MRGDATDKINDLMSDASDAMKDVLYKIPYMKEVVISGELAKLAFDYLVANTPQHIKRNITSGFNTAIAGRWKAFKNWLQAAWTGKSSLTSVISDYEDYLSLFPPGEEGSKDALSLSSYYEATSAAGDEGTYKDYSGIMELMGQTGERDHYVGVRQATR